MHQCLAGIAVNKPDTKNERWSFIMKEKELIQHIISVEMPDLEQVRRNCVNQTLPRNKLPKRGIIISIVIIAMLGLTATAFAYSSTINTVLFDRVPERAVEVIEWDLHEVIEKLKDDPGVILNPDIFDRPNYQGSQYIIEFSHFDEICDLFEPQISKNTFLDVVQLAQYSSRINDEGVAEQYIYGEPMTGLLSVITKDGIPDHAVISSTLILNDLNFSSTIAIPLNPDSLDFDMAGWFHYGLINPESTNIEEYFYENSTNGIIARFIVQPRGEDWNMVIQFTHNGAAYNLMKLGPMGAVDRDPYETGKMLIDAFE